jgi:hypothetical protein
MYNKNTNTFILLTRAYRLNVIEIIKPLHRRHWLYINLVVQAAK